MLELKVGAVDRGMDWLDWTSSVISSLAWPVAAIIIAGLFRSQITSLLAKIRKLSWGDAAVDFTERLDKIETVTQEAQAATPRASIDEPSCEVLSESRFQQLLAISPEAAITWSWLPIERKLSDLASRYAGDKLLRSRDRMNLLHSVGLISSSTLKLLHELQSLRNSAAHSADRNLSAADAVRFEALAQEAMRGLGQIRGQGTPPPDSPPP